jgi:hypothetical protein
LDRYLEFQEVEATKFPDSWHIEVVRLSALAPDAQEIFLVLISVRDWIYSMVIVRPEGL